MRVFEVTACYPAPTTCGRARPRNRWMSPTELAGTCPAMSHPMTNNTTSTQPATTITTIAPDALAKVSGGHHHRSISQNTNTTINNFYGAPAAAPVPAPATVDTSVSVSTGW